MKFFGKVLWFMLVVGAGFMAGMLVDGADFFSKFIDGRLYGLYVLVYTGGAFMGGLWFGQRWERSWESRQDALLKTHVETSSAPNGFEHPSEVSSRERTKIRF